MSRPSRYDEGARKLIAEVGLNKEVATSATELAELIDMPPSVVSRVLNIMQRVGTARKRDEYSGTGGRKVFYTLVGDYAETIRLMKAEGIPWSAFVEEQSRHVKGAPKPQNGSVKSLADLAPLRKSEPRAEIEVARKYRDQQAFIEQQRKMFADMGLELPAIPETITGDRKVELEAIVRILPYVDSIENANRNLETQNKTIRQPQSELSEAKVTIQRQKDQIERLVAEAARGADKLRNEMDEVRQQLIDARRERDEARAELKQIKGDKAINGSITRHEVNAVIAKAGS